MSPSAAPAESPPVARAPTGEMGSESLFAGEPCASLSCSVAKSDPDPVSAVSAVSATPALDPYVERILKASVYDVAIESPLTPAPRLSRRIGAEVLLKREDLQPVHSFKLRGAANRIAALGAAQARPGVICASAGNHAQGVALAAQRRGIAAVVVMPVTTPRIKIEAVRELGAEVLLHGDDFDQACVRGLYSCDVLASDSSFAATPEQK